MFSSAWMKRQQIPPKLGVHLSSYIASQPSRLSSLHLLLNNLECHSVNMLTLLSF